MANEGKKALTSLTAEQDKWSVYSNTRSTVSGQQPLTKEEMDKMTRYFHATLYLCL
ncbi:hypothetical protein KC331_g7103, partial [Hortaea werneckii]